MKTYYNEKKEKFLSLFRGLLLFTALLLVKFDIIPPISQSIFNIFLIISSVYILITTVFPIYKYSLFYKYEIFSAIDVIIVAILVYLTGGISSDLYLFLIFPIVSSAFRYDFRSAILSAILVTLIFTLFGIVQGINIILSSAYIRVIELGIIAIILALFLNYIGRESLRLEQKINEMKIFSEIIKTVNSSLETKEVLSLILESAVKLLGADGGTIFLKDKETGDLIFEKAIGEKGELLEGKKLSKGEGVVGWVVENGSPVIINNPQKDPRFSSYYDKLSGFKTGSIICVPLKVEDEVLGAIEIINSNRNRKFTDYDLDMLMNLAYETSIALNKALLYSQVNLEREKMKKILENVGDGLVILDGRKRLSMFNNVASEIFQLSFGQAGKRCTEVLKCRNLSGEIMCSECPLDKMVFQGLSLMQYEMKVWNGEKEIILGCNLSGTWEGRKVTNFILALRDISLAKELDRMKSEFVANVSHELKTPLTAIKGYSELLMKMNLPPERVRNYYQIIYKESERLTQLVNDLLEVSRIESGRIELKKDMVEIRKIIKERATFFQTRTSKHTIVLQFPEYPTFVLGDSARLTQVFHNLLDNAIKYSPNGGNVWVRVADKMEDILIEVQDQGVGIPPEHLPHIFDRFYRVDSSLRKSTSGTGLGLSIVKSIVEAHGGKISATSKVGEGTTFTIRLPRRFSLIDPLTGTLSLPYFFPILWREMYKTQGPFAFGKISYEFEGLISDNVRKNTVYNLANRLKERLKPNDLIGHGFDRFYLFTRTVMDIEEKISHIPLGDMGALKVHFKFLSSVNSSIEEVVKVINEDFQ
ncbi:ATP-binding protein [Dictyoglomus sp.]|uniref:ATP-binding protein n=1 Tax=Dictyoglomus sp. TaxID=28205 RepID=UPI003D0B4F28